MALDQPYSTCGPDIFYVRHKCLIIHLIIKLIVMCIKDFKILTFLFIFSWEYKNFLLFIIYLFKIMLKNLKYRFLSQKFFLEVLLFLLRGACIFFIFSTNKLNFKLIKFALGISTFQKNNKLRIIDFLRISDFLWRIWKYLQ